jgi:hypothetical protein
MPGKVRVKKVSKLKPKASGGGFFPIHSFLPTPHGGGKAYQYYRKKSGGFGTRHGSEIRRETK